jgi:ribonucleotide monophosphatase NagD (HAD superfamily)
MIGDGLETDIIGANRVSIDALFIVGGIHSALIDDPSGIAKLLTESGARAMAIMPALAW